MKARLAQSLALVLATQFIVTTRAQNEAARKATLDQMLRILPRSEPWEAWLQRTGELPPDFELMNGSAGLPDPLRFADGRMVQSANQWTQRRRELLQLFQRYVTGTVPLAPGNVRAAEAKTRSEAGVTVQEITLAFGPQNKARLFMELLIPPGPGPFPVFMTQDNHRAWALVAASRGYLGCVYAGADSRDDTAAFAELWPEFDWTKLTRRAWAASRCLDYLYTLPAVDRARVALAGHSRNGKQALIAAALDERFTAVVSSSSGAGGACSYRLFSETQFGEGIELITRVFPDWLHPRLRFFVGRENKLPIDQHELIACIAPRACLLSTALNDSVESVWAIEQTYYAAQRVYLFLGTSASLNLRYRPGGHATKADDIEAYLDWLDTKFGRRSFASVSAPIYPTYADWLKASGERIDPLQFPAASLEGLLTTIGGNPILTADQWKAKREDMRRRIQWGLGEAPVSAANPGGNYGAESRPTAELLDRASASQGLEKRSLNFGNYLAGDLYFPTGVEKAGVKMAAVIWLHPISVSNGYVAGYRRGESPHLALARRGFVVFAFDQIGNGNRIEEAQHFYQRYPHWSLLGKTVMDTRAAVDALANLNYVDTRRIYVLGYATGAMAALHAAALDERIAGVISIAGFDPMRLDTTDKGTGGIARWSQWLPLQPRLGAFVGHENRVPYDYHEILALIAPRSVLVVAPRIDYQSTGLDVTRCMGEANKVYEYLNAKNRLSLYVAEDYNHLSPELQSNVFERIQRLASGLPLSE
jgi:dienelactone hydrolase